MLIYHSRISKTNVSNFYPFPPLRVIFPTPHNPAPEALLTFIHTLLALIIILYPVLIIQKEHPQPFFFLPILATAIPSFKMFKLCSLFPFFMPFKRVKRYARHIALSLHQERLKSSISCQKRQSVFKPIAPSDVVTLSYSVCICRNASSKCAKTLSLSARCSFVNDGS